MKRLWIAVCLGAAVMLSGCVVMPPPKGQLDKANYGQVSGPQAERLIRAHLERSLIDPYSYKLSVMTNSMIQHWAKDKYGNYHYGWLVGYKVNAKNHFGGYTGMKSYLAFIEDGQIIQVYTILTGGDDCSPDFRKVGYW